MEVLLATLASVAFLAGYAAATGVQCVRQAQARWRNRGL